MNSKQTALDKAADRLMDLDSAAYGDERERSVFMEASAFGMTLGIYASLVVAFVTALMGSLAAPAVALLLVGIPSWSTIWYASRRGVDVQSMASRAHRKDQVRTMFIMGGGLVLVAVAMSYTVWSGHGLIPVPQLDLMADTAGRSLARGATIGGAIGGLLALVMIALKSRRNPQHRAED